MTAFRARLALLATCLAMAACADHPPRPTPTAHPAPASAPAPTPAPSAAAPVAAPGSDVDEAVADEPVAPDAGRPTGIAACDDYLASYRGCHRAAKVYAPGQIEPHYRLMRQSLMRDAADPATRPQLARRCNALAATLRQALHGKSCEAEAPAASGSSAP